MSFVIWSLFYVFVQRQSALQLSHKSISHLDSLLTKARLNVLHGQISPHFIFNSINNIRALVLEDNNKAREMQANLSDILRYSLQENQSSLISVFEEMEIVEEYLALCFIQFDSRLEVLNEVNKNTHAIAIPRMLVQMLVGNAIKHGISECLNSGQLLVKIYSDEQTLNVEVANTGKLGLPDEASSKGIGLDNIKSRLQLI